MDVICLAIGLVGVVFVFKGRWNSYQAFKDFENESESYEKNVSRTNRGAGLGIFGSLIIVASIGLFFWA